MQVKILFIGPTESGKTVLANFLSDTTENIGGEYKPTAGVRILEFDSHLEKSGKNKNIKVELWDSSGDSKFESCWPAIMKDCNGVVIVFNPDVPSHLKEIVTWHGAFIYQSVQESQCLLIAHHKPGRTVDEGRLSLRNATCRFELFPESSSLFTDFFSDAASQLRGLPLIHSNLEDEPEDVRGAFIRYVGNVAKAMSENQEREEMSIMS